MKYEEELKELIRKDNELVYVSSKDERRQRLNKHIVELHLLQIRDNEENESVRKDK